MYSLILFDMWSGASKAKRQSASCGHPGCGGLLVCSSPAVRCIDVYSHPASERIDLRNECPLPPKPPLIVALMCTVIMQASALI